MDKKNIKVNRLEFKEKKHLIKPIIFVTLLILLQFGFIFYLSRILVENDIVFNATWNLLKFIIIVVFINMNKPMDYKLAWIIPMALMPVPTILLYLALEILPGPKQIRNRLLEVKYKYSSLLTQDQSIQEKIKAHPAIDYGLERYLVERVKYPIYQNTKVDYLPQGEDFFENLKKDLQTAQKFILLEFFIIRPGKMLNEIIEILDRKIHEGVQVKFIYDGMNDYYLPNGYRNYLENLGIEVQVFSPVLPILSTYHNNRDHRKIVIIDNKIAYTGGVNLSDEYINENIRFGHWKDNGIRMEGEAVKNVTVMFYYLWNLNSSLETDVEKFIKDTYYASSPAFVQPFDDSPSDFETVGENVYVDILNQAKDYAYILSPYLIPSENVLNAIKFASKRGVDVRIMVPGIPDKIIPFAIARSYYKNLLNSGVKIYEYSEGFLHSKAIVSDDLVSNVGSINLDYRSFHLNYENGVLVYDQEFAKSIYNDFMETLPKCSQINTTKYKELNIFYRIFGGIARLFAPLM